MIVNCIIEALMLCSYYFFIEIMLKERGKLLNSLLFCILMNGLVWAGTMTNLWWLSCIIILLAGYNLSAGGRKHKFVLFISLYMSFAAAFNGLFFRTFMYKLTVSCSATFIFASLICIYFPIWRLFFRGKRYKRMRVKVSQNAG